MKMKSRTAARSAAEAGCELEFRFTDVVYKKIQSRTAARSAAEARKTDFKGYNSIISADRQFQFTEIQYNFSSPRFHESLYQFEFTRDFKFIFSSLKFQ